MAFQFGFAADGGSDNEESPVAPQELSSGAANPPGVPLSIHKLEDLVGHSTINVFCTSYFLI